MNVLRFSFLNDFTHDDDLVTLSKGQRERIKQKELLVTPNKINIKKSSSTPGTINGNLTNNGTPIRKYLLSTVGKIYTIFLFPEKSCQYRWVWSIRVFTNFWMPLFFEKLADMRASHAVLSLSVWEIHGSDWEIHGDILTNPFVYTSLLQGHPHRIVLFKMITMTINQK